MIQQSYFLSTYPKEMKSLSLGDFCTAVVISALFTIAKTQKQVSTGGWMDKEYVAYTYNGILFSYEKEGNTDICDNMDASWGHYVSEII